MRIGPARRFSLRRLLQIMIPSAMTPRRTKASMIPTMSPISPPVEILSEAAGCPFDADGEGTFSNVAVIVVSTE